MFLNKGHSVERSFHDGVIKNSMSELSEEKRSLTRTRSTAFAFIEFRREADAEEAYYDMCVHIHSHPRAAQTADNSK